MDSVEEVLPNPVAIALKPDEVYTIHKILEGLQDAYYVGANNGIVLHGQLTLTREVKGMDGVELGYIKHSNGSWRFSPAVWYAHSSEESMD